MNFKHRNIMKRNIIRVALLAVFAFVAGYGVYTSQKETSMSDLAMANVEALASGESGGNHITCYSGSGSSFFPFYVNVQLVLGSI